MCVIDVYLVERIDKDGSTYPHSIYASKENALSIVRILARGYKDAGWAIFPTRLEYDAGELIRTADSCGAMQANDAGYVLL